MTRSRAYLFFAFCALGGIAALAIRRLAWPFADRQIFILLLLLLAVVCVMPAWRRFRSQALDPFEPPIFTGLMYLLLFGLLSLPFLDPEAPLYPFLGGEFGWLSVALLYLILGMVFLWLGYRSGLAVWIERVMGLSENWRERQREEWVRFSWVIALYAIGASARVYRIRTGTYGYLGGQVLDAVSAQLPYSNWLWHLETFCSYSQVLATIRYYSAGGVKDRVTFWIILVGELFFGLVSGFRTPIFLAFLYMGVVSFYQRRRVPWGAALVGALVLLFVFPLVPVYRRLIYGGAIDVTATTELVSSIAGLVADAVQVGGVSETIERGAGVASVHMSRIQDFASAIKYADQHSLYPERHYVWVFPLLVFLPRAVWPSKPQLMLGGWMNREVLGRLGVSANAATYPGGLYLYLGYWGYLAGMFATGVLQCFVYRRYSLGKPLSRVFLAPFLFLAVGNPESDFVAHFAGVVQQVMLLVIIARLAFARGRRESFGEVGGETAMRAG